MSSPTEALRDKDLEYTVLPTERDWDARREEIIYLYRDREYTLNDVLKAIQQKYRWKVTPRMFKTRFDKWGIRKYQKHIPRRERPSKARRRPASTSVTLAIRNSSDAPDSGRGPTDFGFCSLPPPLSISPSSTAGSGYSASAAAAGATIAHYPYSYTPQDTLPTPPLQSSPKTGYSYVPQNSLAAYSQYALSSQAPAAPRSSTTSPAIYAPQHHHPTSMSMLPVSAGSIPMQVVPQHVMSPPNTYLPRSSAFDPIPGSYSLDYADSLSASSPLLPLTVESKPSVTTSAAASGFNFGGSISRHSGSKCLGGLSCSETTLRCNAELLRLVPAGIASSGIKSQVDMYQNLSHSVAFLTRLRGHIRKCCQDEELVVRAEAEMLNHVHHLVANIYPALCSGIVGLVKVTTSNVVLGSFLSTLETEAIATHGLEHPVSQLAMCLQNLFLMHPQNGFSSLIEDMSQQMGQQLFETFGRGSPVGLYHVLEGRCSYLVDDGVLVNMDGLLDLACRNLQSHSQSQNNETEMFRSMIISDPVTPGTGSTTANGAASQEGHWVEARAVIELIYKVARTKLDIKETDPSISSLTENVLHRCSEFQQAAAGDPHSKRAQTELAIVNALVPRIYLILAQNLYYRGIKSADEALRNQALQCLEDSLERSSKYQHRSKLFSLSLDIARRMFNACNDSQALVELQQMEGRFRPEEALGIN
ncbi:hypothetical protein HOO65_090064 [Ceratocystis lukuohia]|uniref:Clr5 domain-containing protein n=1 Tax=Ceratocystis lukuohia TaxID=2019550 RepID=A0ABR4M922_9PEZI